MKKRLMSVLSFAAALLMLLGGCGSKPEAETTLYSTEPETTEETVSAPPIIGAGLDWIVEPTLEYNGIQPLYNCYNLPSKANYMRYIDNGKWGLLDLKGNVVMKASYYNIITEDYMESFGNDPDELKKLQSDNGAYVIAVMDAEGAHFYLENGMKKVSDVPHGHGLPEDNEYYYNLDDDLIYVSEYGNITMLDTMQYSYTDSDNYIVRIQAVKGLKTVEETGSFEFSTYTGKFALLKNFTIMLTDFVYQDIRATATSKIIAVQNFDNKWGYIRNDASRVTDCIFDQIYIFNESPLLIYDFVDGYCAVSFEGKLGVINEKGEYVLNPEFEAVRVARGGVAFVQVDGKWGVTRLGEKLQ